MGVSYFVEGYVEPDEKWLKMKAVYDACVSAGVAIPSEVEKFFDGPPSEAGMPVKLKARSLSEPGYDIVEVVVKDIPEFVKLIRFKVGY
jgi:hypothetical protein